MKKASRKLRIRPLLCGLALLTSFTLTGCSVPGSSGSAGGRPQNTKIYVIGQSQGISFWDDVEQGANEAGEEFGYEIHYSNAESVSDVQSQIDLINEAISQQANAIVISPNDEAKLKDSIQAARDAGLTIITINADFEDTSMRSSYVGTNNLTAGKIAGRHIVEALTDPVNEKILVVTHSETANSAVSRVSGMCMIDGPAYGQAMQKSMQEAAMARAAAMQQGGQGNAGGPPEGAGGPPADAQQGNAGGPPADAQQGNAGGPPADAQQGNAGGPPADAQQGNAGGPPADAQQGNAGGPPADAQQGNAGGPPPDGAGGPPAEQSGPSEEAAASREAAMQGGKGTLPANVMVRNCGGDLNVAKTMTMEALKENPDIKVVYSTNETSTLGVCQAIQELGLEPDEMTVIGFNSNESELQYLRGGVLDALVVQNPYNIGYLGVYYAGQFATGGGASGMEYTGVVYVTAENIDDDDIQLILDPKKYIGY